MDEMVNETVDETTIDDFNQDNESSGIIGKILVGGVTVAVGTAAALAIKNRDKIKEKFEIRKEARRQAKVKKAMDKLAKLEAKAPKPVEAEKEE